MQNKEDDRDRCFSKRGKQLMLNGDKVREGTKQKNEEKSN